jgi:peptidoglycan/LPS O-acetylase OafA/YrhL
MHYRPEIDGLRAVAVLPVILFHGGFTVFRGGYVGVDVFFVISGFLITNILVHDLARGKFSIIRFYERRARRILPALFFLMLCCIPFAWMWMIPSALKNFSQSLAAVSAFASNILFWREDGYFAAASEEKPLLHTWSLAVEEQYYILFPVFLLLLWRFGRNPAFYTILAISIVSLLSSEWGWRHKPDANFYFTLTRAWALLSGSICAFIQYGRAESSNNVLSAFGLALIVFAILFFDEATPYPSVYALVPVVGTALIIIFGTQNTWTAKLLSRHAFVGIGLISYSAYLWHQPLFAFARIRSIYPPERWLMLLLAAVSLVIAYVSWRYIEQPFRRKSSPSLPSRRALFGMAFFISSTFIALGILGHINGGFWHRFANVPIALIQENDDWQDNSECHISNAFSEEKVTRCLSGLEGKKVILIGDSHADAISKFLRIELERHGIGLISFTRSACLPILFTSRVPKEAHAECETFKSNAYDFIAQNPDVPVIIIARWALNILGTRFDNGEGGIEYGENGLNFVLDHNGRIDTDADVLQNINLQLTRLSNANPTVILTQFPEAGWNVTDILIKSTIYEKFVKQISTSKVSYDVRNSSINDFLNSLSSKKLSVINVQEIFCDTFIIDRCVIYYQDVMYYRDDDHPSSNAAKLISSKIVKNVKLLPLILE